MGQIIGQIEGGCYFVCKAMATPQRVQALKKAGLQYPAPRVIRVLIDTGASSTTVDHAVIRGLGLEPTGATLVHTPSTGGSPVAREIFDLSIVFGEASAEPRTYTLPVVATDFTGHWFGILVGWDILSRCVLKADGPNGVFTLDY